MKLTERQLRRIIREAMQFDLSGHKPTLKKLQKMDPEHAMKLALSLEADQPGILDAWAMWARRRREELDEELDVAYTKASQPPFSRKDKQAYEDLKKEYDALYDVGNDIADYFNRQLVGDASYLGAKGRMSESVSRNEIQKIEQLWWNQDQDSGEFPQRQMALALIESLGIDPASLRIWTLAYPWGELYEPWTFYGGGGEDPGFTIDDINRILEYYNSHNTTKGLELAIDERIVEDGMVMFAHPSGADSMLSYDEDGMYYVSDLVEKATFETAQ